jgi:hypothetical protein
MSDGSTRELDPSFYEAKKESAPPFVLESDEFIEESLSSGDAIDFGTFPDILSKSKILERTGEDFGDLVGVIQLPYKEGMVVGETPDRRAPNKLYCFRKPESDGQHALAAYTIMGEEQLEAIRNDQAVPERNLLKVTMVGEKKEVGRNATPGCLLSV